MAKYRLTEIAELAHQLKLSPTRLRWQQINGAEYLLDLIETDKVYPYEFVCYHITGHRLKHAAGGAGLSGKSLVTDLVQLIEELSSHPVLDVASIPEAVWSTEQLARRLHVSTKTICRWRRRGLAGRKLRFADGNVRVAFTERCVRRFIRRNAAMVRRGAAFRQLTKAEKQHIIERARELLGVRRIRLHELSQTIAGEIGRAVETVRYTLRRHDREHPAQALFGHGEQPLISPEHQALYAGYVAGEAPDRLARRFKLTPAAVERIIRECRARQLLARPIQYVYSHEFDAPGADALILGSRTDHDDQPADVPAAASGVPRDLPPYLRDLYREPLLTPAQERNLFRQYNYLKFKAVRLRERIDPLCAEEEQLRKVEEILAAADEARSRIVRANLRLVVSIARRHVGGALGRAEFFEIISDGNVSLLRAVEKFDYTRGNKFSTYASWAIMRNYARTIPETLYQESRRHTGTDDLLETLPDRHEPAPDADEREGLRRTIHHGLAQLTDRERAIIMRHFGLIGDEKPETLDEIGRRYGVTKERIRQIERKAMKKLREILGEKAAAVCLDSG